MPEASRPADWRRPLYSHANRTIDQCLIGEIELRRPVDGGAARELVPLLIDHAGAGIAISGHEQARLGYREMLLVFGPAQTACQLQIGEDIVISLAKTRIGIQRIGILTQEIIVPFVVKAG